MSDQHVRFAGPTHRRIEHVWRYLDAVESLSTFNSVAQALYKRCETSTCRRQRRSIIVTLARPPPSQTVCKPYLPPERRSE